MVFVKDYVKEFYDVIRHRRVVIFVHMDVDALSACKMLQYLLQCDHVLYTIIPIAGQRELERAYLDNSTGVATFLLINCGGGLDIVETLQPEEGVQFFICDSHRPINVFNIYNAVQVKLLVAQEELEGIPEYEDVFRDDSDEELGGSDDEDNEPSEKQPRHDADYLEKRRERRLWDSNRQKLLMGYYQFASIGRSAAHTLFDLAWKLSRDTNDMLWLAIVGVTSQFVHRKVDYEHYFERTQELQSHVSRLNQRAGSEEAQNSVSIDCLRIEFDTELQLDLYRQWSLFDSLRHSPLTACHFRIWTMKGKKRLQEFLADMGLSLVQSRQKFSAMDRKVRDGIKKLIEEHVQKFGMELRDVFMPAFHAIYGYKNKPSAGDIVHSCTATLEDLDGAKTSSDRFLEALDVLSRNNVCAYDHGIAMAKQQLEALLRQVHTFLDTSQVISAGTYLYAFVQESTSDARHFANAVCLHRLAVFTLEAFLATTKSKRARSLPLIVAAPLDLEKGTCLVLGIPPLDVIKKDNGRNCFGEVFNQAVANTRSRTLHDFFDTNMIELKNEDRSKFFDALISVLTM